MYVPAKERGGALQYPKSTLDEILEKINEKYKGDFTDADKVMLGALHDMLIAHPKLKSSALTTDPRIFSESIFSSAFGTAHGELYGLHCSRARCSHVGLGGDGVQRNEERQRAAKNDIRACDTISLETGHAQSRSADVAGFALLRRKKYFGYKKFSNG